MKKLFLLLLCSLFVLALVGCGQKSEGEAEDTSAGGHVDEMADTTRMDSAMDSMANEGSMGGEEEAGHESSEGGH